MRKIVLFLFMYLCFIGTKSFAQNTCATPEAIPTPTSGSPFSSGTKTTCGTLNDYLVGAYYAGSYGGGEDYVYSITITSAPQTFIMTLGGAATWKIASVHSACPPLSTNAIGGISTSSGTSGTANISFATNGTYYIFIDTWPAPDCGEFTLGITLLEACTTPLSQPSGLTLTPSSAVITGNFSAAIPAADNYLVVRTTSSTPPTNPVDGTTYTAAASALGGVIVYSGALTTFTSTNLVPGTEYYYWVYSFNNTACAGPIYLTTSPLSLNETTTAANNITSTTQGGLWNNTATWVGGILPVNGDNVTIANGATVVVNRVDTLGSLTIGGGTSGVLQWGGTSFALTVRNNLTILAGAKFLPYTSVATPVGQTINLGGNFINNGFTNLAAASTLLNFNGSVQGTSMAQTLSGSGVFVGDGTKGILRGLYFQTTGSSTITTTQDLITSGFAHTAGTLNTNGKLAINNTSQVYGAPINLQVASVAVTTMGTAYTTAPVVFGGAVSLWTASGAASLNTRYFSGINVYIATTAGTFDASVAPTHTSGSANNGTVPLLWVGTLGTLGNPFIPTAVTIGTQYFYGNNLYVCTVAGIPSTTAPPTHLTGAVVSGAATFLYVGSPATAMVNYDATAQNVRSLTLVSGGNGYSSVPSVTFSLNGGTVTTAAVAIAIYFQTIAGPTSSLTQKSGVSTISGGLTINSTNGASSYSGVGNVSTANGGVNYTVAPTVGFAGPTAINLVTNGGSGYTVAPTITVTGGTLVTGTALTTSNFTITVAGGKVVSVYLATGTTATYSVAPTLAFSAGTATLAFPVGCWPAATAIIGTNGQITNFNVTNTGFGYVAAPTVGIGTVTATALGGTFTTVATAPTCRIALYNITLNYFAPAITNVINTDQSIFPINGKMNNISLAGSGLGSSVSSNLELFAASPITLTSGILDFGTNTLSFTHPNYTGASGTALVSVTGNIVLSSPGGSVTRTFPFNPPLAMTTGTGSLATGSTITSLTASRTAAPTGTVNASSGNITGKRAYRIQANAGTAYGIAPTVTLNWNAADTLTTPENFGVLIGQATALSGAWTVRSLSSGTGTLSITGSRTTATSVAGPIVPTGDDYYAWITASLCAGTPITGVISGSTTACAGSTASFTSSTVSTGLGMTSRWETSTTSSSGPWTGSTTTTPTTFSTPYVSGSLWVRRADTCTNSGFFSYSNVMEVTARATSFCYCGPNTSTTIHIAYTNPIENVTIAGTTLNNSNPGIGNATTGYTEFPQAGSTTATLLQSTSYVLSTTIATSSIASVWIDYNRNGSYEATEWVQITASGGGTAAINTNINVPANAAIGTTGMRIRTRGAGNANAGTDACTSFGGGETEEYYITIAAPPACSGTPTAGTVTGPLTTICAGSVILNATGFTNGLSGLTYRWQSSTNNVDWTNTIGTNPVSFTTNVTSSTWFRLVDTCTNGNAFAVSNAVQVNINAATYATLPVTEGFEGTWINGCGTADIPSNSWRNTPTTTDSSWRRSDDPISGGNTAVWGNPTSYAYSPLGQTGSNSARFHSGFVNAGRRGMIDLYIDCSVGLNTKELSYGYINTSGSDSLRVMLSTDGGVTFSLLGSKNAIAATWTNYTIPFTSSSANSILRFVAYADFGSTDIGLDNVNVITLNNCSGTPLAGIVTGPSTTVCAGSVTLTAAGYSAGVVGLTYRWQSSPDGLSAWTNTTGTNPASFTTTVAANTWFRLVDTCTFGNGFATSPAVQVMVNPLASLQYNQGFETITANNTLPGCMTATSLGGKNLTYIAATGSYNQAPRNGTKFAAFAWNPGAAGAWFFSDPILLTGGVAYDARVWYVTDGASGFDSLKIAFGSGNTASAMGNGFAKIANPTNTTYAALNGTFTPSTTGVYFLGYQVVGTSTTPWYVTIDDLSAGVSGTLPVSLSNISAKRIGNINEISWSTASEQNNNGFEVERSIDGVNFSKIGFVPSKGDKGNSNATLNYSFEDLKLNVSISYYYRLRQIDFNGKVIVSSTVLVKGSKSSKIEFVNAYPNPANEKINVVISSPKAEKVTMNITDLMGKLLSTQVVNIINGENNIALNISSYSKGTYLIKVNCAEGCDRLIGKFVKQ